MIVLYCISQSIITILFLIIEVGSLITLLLFQSVHPEVLCHFEMLLEIVIVLKLTTAVVHVVQSLSSVRLFAAPWTAARQASLSFTISQNLLKLMSIKLAMPSNHLILCHPLLFLPSIFPSIRVFSSESVLHKRWPKY